MCLVSFLTKPMVEAQVPSEAGRRLRGASMAGLAGGKAITSRERAVAAMNASGTSSDDSGGLQVLTLPSASWAYNSQINSDFSVPGDGGSSNASGPQWRPTVLPNASNVLPNASNTSDLTQRGPGYCATTWAAEPNHGADYSVGTVYNVDLNHCLMHCWSNAPCWCVTFHHNIDHAGMHLTEYNEWRDTGTCYMMHKCDTSKVEKQMVNSEVCVITSTG
jgi:hypothetical protein